jgi:hypothetical protein
MKAVSRGASGEFGLSFAAGGGKNALDSFFAAWIGDFWLGWASLRY